MSAQTAVFVLGMHRSGTSALARTLNLLGASLPRRVYPSGIGNETGHWEPAEGVRLHDRLLEAAGTSVNDLYGPSESWFQTEAAYRFSSRMKELIRDEFDDAPLFVFKDPRSALVFPLWKRVLAQMQIRCVAAVISRNPVEVALSLVRRQTHAMPGQSWSLDRAGLLWLRYVLAAELHTRGMPRSFCLYGSLLQDWRRIADQLARDLELAWPRQCAEAECDVDRFLSPQLRHHHESDSVGARSEIWSYWLAPAFAALNRADAGSELDRAIFDSVRQSFQNVCNSLRPEGSPEGGPPTISESSSNRPFETQRAAQKRLCLVVSASHLADGRADQLRAILEEATGVGFRITLIKVGAVPDAVGAILNQLAVRHHLDVQSFDPSALPIRPGYLQATIGLFRHLRSQHFDVVLFPDQEGLGYASIVAKYSGLAFAGTVLAVIALGASRRQRERDRQFPHSLVPIAVEYIEQKAVEFGDLVLLSSQEVALWMQQAGWRIGATLTLPDGPTKSQPEQSAWASIVRDQREKRRPTITPGAASRPVPVTVIITSFEQPKLLDQNLEALTQQIDRDFSVVIVDDGSRTAEARDYLAGVEERYRGLSLRLIRQDNRYLGAARNTGIRAANTDYVILLDDDNVAFPDMVRALREAIRRTEADVVTCGIRHFTDATDMPYLGMDSAGPDHFFSGGPVLLGAVHNCFGDVSGIYRRGVFEKVGYFHELRGVVFEDWQLHLKIVVAGYSLLSLPEPLVWYRIRPNSLLRTTSRYDNARVIAATVREMPCSILEPLVDYLIGSEAEQVRLNSEIRSLQTVAEVNSIALMEARSEASRHAQKLEEALAQTSATASSAEQYARSLEKALAELRESHRAATEYAAKLEQSRAVAEAYARTLEQEREKNVRDPVEPPPSGREPGDSA